MIELVKRLIYRFAGIDEGGDLGMSQKSSTHFILSCFLHNDENLDRKVRKFISKLNHKKNKRKISVLHARLDDDTIKIRLIKFLSTIDFRCLVYVCKKDKNRFTVVNYHEMLQQFIDEHQCEKIYLSSPTNKQSFQNKILDVSNKITITTPRSSTAIQLADLFAWAVIKKLEQNDDLYFKVLADKLTIVEFKQKQNP